MGSLRKPLESRSEAHVGFSKIGSHLEKSLSARFPLVVDKNRRYVSRLTTRKKATRQAVCCELGFLIRADWEKLAGSHPDSHIADICPRRRVTIPYSQSPPSEGCSTTVCDCTSGIKTPLPRAWRKRDERNTGYDWAHTAITQLAMKNAIATGNRLREEAGKRRRGTRRATAEADTRRDRRERSIQFAKYCEIIDSHNFASCFTPPERSEAR